MSFEEAKDVVAKKNGYLNWEEFEVAQVREDNEQRTTWTWVLESKHWDEAAELYCLEEKKIHAREQMIKLLDWYDKLTPSQKVSVWSKNGEYKGLFTMDSEQLVDQFLRPEFKP